MTQVYSSNLDSVTNNTTPPGFTALSGVFVAQTAANGARPVSGTQASLTQATEGNTALYTGAGALASADWQSSHVVLINGGDIAINHHVLRSDASFANGYRVAIVYSGGNYTAVLIKRVGGGNTNLGAGSGTPTPLAVTNGDKVLMATTISGSTINLYLWKQGGSRPATPNYTWTDSAISAAGYPGLYAALGTQGSAPSSDDFVLDDMQVTVGAATGVTLAGPSGGTTGVASTNFTAGVSPVGGTITGTVVVTPSDGGAGGTFSPTTVSLTSASPTGTFTYTPASAGAKTISTTNNASLTNPTSITYTAAAANTPPTFNGTVANITGTGGTAITPADVHALFSDTDTLTYSASPAGTAWPSGLVINSATGVISGTVATSTTTGLKVRATDTASQTVDSNAFSVTISAPASTVSGVTVSPTTATVSGGGSQTFTATVAGTNSPSQTVNWSMTGAGSINASTGVYTAPATTSSAQTATITATSAQDNTKSGTANVTVPAATATTSYVDMGTDACDNIQSGLMASTGLTAVVINRSDLTVAKQVITGIATTTGSLVPRFATTFAVGTPVHVVFINAADNTATGIVSDHVTVA